MRHTKKTRVNHKNSPKIKITDKKVSEAELEKIVGGATTRANKFL